MTADCGVADGNTVSKSAADATGKQVSGARCGNGVCEAGDGESCVSCAQDCNGKQSGGKSQRYCCGDGHGENPVPCSDQRCTANLRTCTTTPAPTRFVCCGDQTCDVTESCATCPADCPVKVEVCTGGLDEDCDGLVDCGDPQCGGDPACQGCRAGGAACTSDAQCCSKRCNPGSKRCK